MPGGSNIPYMLYLARGRDQVKPACAVLLDGDTAGETARKQIKRGGALRKPIVDDELVVIISKWAEEAQPDVADGVVVREPEDFVPVSVAVLACRRAMQRRSLASMRTRLRSSQTTPSLSDLPRRPVASGTHLRKLSPKHLNLV